MARWKQRGPCDFTYLRLESESKKSVFGNSVFPSATIFEGYTQAESRNAVSPSRFFVEKNHGSQPPATADSIIFTSFRCSGKKHEFQNVVRNLNFKKSSRCYIGFRMGVPDMGVDLGYIYAKYPPKILNKRSTYGKFFYILLCANNLMRSAIAVRVYKVLTMLFYKLLPSLVLLLS